MDETTEGTAPDNSNADAGTQEAEGQPSPQAGAEQEQEAKGADQAQAPQAGAEFIIPDGFEMDANGREETKQFFAEIAKITDPRAREQAIINKHFESLQRQADAGAEATQAQHQQWAVQARTDPEFGGAELSENMAGARKAMNSFSNPAVDGDGKPVLHTDGPHKGQQMTEIESFMNETGLGNDPRMIRVFHRVNKALSEDKFVSGQMKPHVQKKSAAETMYPSMAK